MLKTLANSCVFQSIFLAGIVYYVCFYITCSDNVARDFPPQLPLQGVAPTQENSLQDIVQILDDAEGECHWDEGDWVWDESYPLYESRNCEFLDQAFRCSENGRPNNSYSKWRWQPKNCNIPRFDAVMMLEKLRNRRLVFVGDSMGRNQWQSLLCMLSSAIAEKDSIYEVTGNKITKHTGFLIFKFKSYNCTVEYYRSPFLVMEGQLPSGAPEKVEMFLKLDVMDSSSSQWRDADILIFNTGYWWNHCKIKRRGCYFQISNKVKTNMSIESAYRKSIETLFLWISREVDSSKTVIFRTYAPAHYRDRESVGHCHLKLKPEISSTLLLPSPSWAYLVNPIIELPSAIDPGLFSCEIMNVTQMTVLRPDGHPSTYYLGATAGPSPLNEQDCGHWCLRGIPDTWNELLYARILTGYLL
ncbi:hypothetical protein MRB53_010870 [Persea americana]|uniref:Uncharacterized protein n=1 Tax=Persea americana TaxID=3435 RepID=A0ACC2LTT0_PERAE|nr:hypothetical protein MRB53_010870 [Persea americana]